MPSHRFVIVPWIRGTRTDAAPSPHVPAVRGPGPRVPVSERPLPSGWAALRFRGLSRRGTHLSQSLSRSSSVVTTEGPPPDLAGEGSAGCFIGSPWDCPNLVTASRLCVYGSHTCTCSAQEDLKIHLGRKGKRLLSAPRSCGWREMVAYEGIRCSSQTPGVITPLGEGQVPGGRASIENSHHKTRETFR